MTTNDTSDAYDPTIAEQFQVLAHVEAPDLEPVASPNRRWVMVAAAVVVALAGIGALFTTYSGTREPEDVIGAAESDDEQISTPSTETKKLEVPAISAADGTEMPSNDDEQASDNDPPSETTIEPEAETTTTEKPAPSDSEIVASGENKIITGVVTEVLSDCGSWVKLDPNGKTYSPGRLCDDGSYITVGNVRIRTGTGYPVPGAPRYDRQPSVGLGVNVKVVAVEDANGNLTLDCEQCRVTVI